MLIFGVPEAVNSGKLLNKKEIVIKMLNQGSAFLECLPEKSETDMADIKMNTFPQVTDAAYIYAEGADGSQVKIKKSDLVEVIRAAMPEATNSFKGLMSSFFFKSVINSPVTNSYTSNGAQITTCDGVASSLELGAFYIIPSSECSLSGKGDGVIITIRRSFLTAQIFFSRDGKIYYRNSENYNSFNSWKLISFT